MNFNINNINNDIVFSDDSLTKRVIFSTDYALCFVLNLKVGQSLPLHRHETSCLSLIVVQGSGEIQVNDEIREVTKGTVLIAKGEDDFSILSVSEDLSLYVTLSPRPQDEKYAKNFG